MGARWLEPRPPRPRPLLPVARQAWARFAALSSVWQLLVVGVGVVLLLTAIGLI